MCKYSELLFIFFYFLIFLWIWQALHKKENKACESPDPDSSYALTPRTEEKYKKINEEFDNMIKSHKIPVSTKG